MHVRCTREVPPIRLVTPYNSARKDQQLKATRRRYQEGLLGLSHYAVLHCTDCIIRTQKNADQRLPEGFAVL